MDATDGVKGGKGRDARHSASSTGLSGEGHQGRGGSDVGTEKEDDGNIKVRELLGDLNRVSPEWEEIGRLLGIEDHELEVIRINNMQASGVKRCFSEMWKKWLQSTVKSRDENWFTVCNVLKTLKKIQLASEVARKHGLYPKITVQPQDQHAALGGTVTFRCKTGTSGSIIIYQWLHMCDGHKVKKQSTSAQLDIKEVTEGDRGKYSCVVKNDFGEVELQPAELIIGVKLNEDNLRRILKDAGIKDTDWPQIGECLGQDVRSAFTGGILMRIQECPMDKTKLWHKLAETLKGMKGCSSAAQKAKDIAGKELIDSEDTVIMMFEEAGIKKQDIDWCKINEKLGHHQHKEPRTQRTQQSTEGTLQGSESEMVATGFKYKNVTWKELAKALGQIQVYYSVVDKANRKYEEVKITEGSLRNVFMDASAVDWHQVAKCFPSFNESCLKAVMTLYSKEECKNPWRKLAASVESLKEDSCNRKEVKIQLGIGYKLRLLSGVGLELKSDNLSEVLTKAGIQDWNTIVSVLKVDPSWSERWGQRLINIFKKADPIPKQILQKWPDPQSWEELARAIEDSEDLYLKNGHEISQKTRELSGSGGLPKIRDLYTPKLKGKIVTFETDVTFTCEARGAPPLKYNWTCDGHDLHLPDSWTVSLKVKRGGKYNCRVENDFGCDTSEAPIEIVCGNFPTFKFEQQKINILIGEKLSLHCEARGTEPLHYTWLYNDDELLSKSEKYHAEGPDLIVMEMTRDDAGNYGCLVANKFGKHTSAVEVKVGEHPKIKPISLQGPKRVHYERDITLCLYCEASGSPILRYTWLHRKGKYTSNVGTMERLMVVTAEETEGEYMCHVKNDFGEVTSDPIGIKVGDKPKIKAPPKIARKVVPGKQVQLTCEAEGKGPFKYVWMHNNQTLVKEAGSCQNKAVLTIEQMTEANQGEYKCSFTNAFGFNVSEPVTLWLEITLEEVMKQLCPDSSAPISRRWYMLGILLEVEKTVLDRISRGFIANSEDSTREVIRSWLEKKYDPKNPSTRSWETIRNAVSRMGFKKLAQDLDAKPKIEAPLKVEGIVAYGEKITLTCKATGRPPFQFTWLLNDIEIQEVNNSKFTIDSMDETDEGEYKCKLTNEVGSAISEAITLKPGLQIEKGILAQKQAEERANYDAKDMSTEFENLAGNVEELLTNLDSSDTESDTAVSGIQAYLHLIEFKQEDIEKVEDLHSGIELLRQYWNYQRYHLLKKVINQFSSEKARTKMEEFIDHFSTYQATTKLGDFVPLLQLEGSSDGEKLVPATLEGDPYITTAKNPPFMNSFKIKLESKWASCTLKDADNLLLNLLPDTVSREFVWSSVVYREEENHAVCLEYLVSPTVVELLNTEMEMRKKSMHYMGILCVQVDSDEFKPEPYKDPLGRPLRLPPGYQSSITRSHFEEQGIPLEIQSPNKQLGELKQQLEELKSVVTGYTTKIEALQKDYETRSTYGPAIEALQTDLHTTKENLKKVSTQVKGQSEKSMTLGARIGVLDKKVDRNQQIAKKVIAEVTGKPVPSMTQHERVKQNITGEGMDESALAAAGSSTMTSEEQGNHQEPLDTTSVMKILKELLEGQQELREAQWRTESKIAEGSSAKISEGLRGKNE